MCDGEETTRSITPLIFPKVKIMKNQGGGVQMKEYIEDNEIIQDYIGLYDKKEIVEERDDEDVDKNVRVESCSVCKVQFITAIGSSRMELEIGDIKICDNCYDGVEAARKTRKT